MAPTQPPHRVDSSRPHPSKLAQAGPRQHSQSLLCFDAAFDHFPAVCAVIDLGSDMSWLSSGIIEFFCTQVLGTMLEDSVQAVYFSAFSRSQHPTSTSRTLRSRCLSYARLTSLNPFQCPHDFLQSCIEQGVGGVGGVRGVRGVGIEAAWGS